MQTFWNIIPCSRAYSNFLQKSLSLLPLDWLFKSKNHKIKSKHRNLYNKLLMISIQMYRIKILSWKSWKTVHHDQILQGYLKNTYGNEPRETLLIIIWEAKFPFALLEIISWKKFLVFEMASTPTRDLFNSLTMLLLDSFQG